VDKPGSSVLDEPIKLGREVGTSPVLRLQRMTREPLQASAKQQPRYHARATRRKLPQNINERPTTQHLLILAIAAIITSTNLKASNRKNRNSHLIESRSLTYSISYILAPSPRQVFEMGDVLVENPANYSQPLRKTAPSTIPSIENFEGAVAEDGDEYLTLKRLQRQLEYIQLQEEYIKDEQRYYQPSPPVRQI